MKNTSHSSFVQKTYAFLKRHYLTRNFLLLLFVTAVLILTVKFSLDLYTNLGQRIEMLNLKNLPLQKAQKIIEPYDFKLIIYDSVFIPSKKGHIILSQNPQPGSYVKKGRKVYVVITKSIPDTFLSANLPDLYGKNYHIKKKEIEHRFDVHLVIAGEKYDPGPPDMIYEVRYKGKPIISSRTLKKNVPIARGDTLEVIVTSHNNPEVAVPSLRCKILHEAVQFLALSHLKKGKIQWSSPPANPDSAYVVDQDPPKGTVVGYGTQVNLIVSSIKPSDCP